MYGAHRARPTWGALQSSTTATASALSQSIAAHRLRVVAVRHGTERALTNRTSPASAHSFVVNHSHMNTLVEPSFTEVTRPWMSLFTARARQLCTRPARVHGTRTLELQLVGRPALLQRHHIRHRLAPAARRGSQHLARACGPRADLLKGKMPTVVPFRSAICWNLDTLPVITALRRVHERCAGTCCGGALTSSVG